LQPGQHASQQRHARGFSAIFHLHSLFNVATPMEVNFVSWPLMMNSMCRHFSPGSAMATKARANQLGIINIQQLNESN